MFAVKGNLFKISWQLSHEHWRTCVNEVSAHTRALCVLQTEVMDLVQLMGGRVYRDLNVSVTHLVAGEVGSKKYVVAANLGKPVVLPSWVKACWEKSQDR